MGTDPRDLHAPRAVAEGGIRCLRRAPSPALSATVTRTGLTEPRRWRSPRSLSDSAALGWQ